MYRVVWTGFVSHNSTHLERDDIILFLCLVSGWQPTAADPPTNAKNLNYSSSCPCTSCHKWLLLEASCFELSLACKTKGLMQQPKDLTQIIKYPSIHGLKIICWSKANLCGSVDAIQTIREFGLLIWLVCFFLVHLYIYIYIVWGRCPYPCTIIS